MSTCDLVARQPFAFFGGVPTRGIYDNMKTAVTTVFTGKERVFKPGALRNGAPFQDWELPPALARLRRKLGSGDEADRGFWRPCWRMAWSRSRPPRTRRLPPGPPVTTSSSDDVILNILARRREPPRPLSIVTPEDLALRHPPLADCDRYDSLRGQHAAA